MQFLKIHTQVIALNYRQISGLQKLYLNIKMSWF